MAKLDGDGSTATTVASGRLCENNTEEYPSFAPASSIYLIPNCLSACASGGYSGVFSSRTVASVVFLRHHPPSGCRSMHVKATDVSAVQTGGGEIDGCKRDGAEQSFVTEESGKASDASDRLS